MGKQGPEELEIGASADGINVKAKGTAVARLTNAIVDAVSPFTEGLGILGDVVRYYRQDMAMKSIGRSIQISEKLAIPVRPVPTKFLVDWIEKASLEESNDVELTDMWAGLLLSAGNIENPSIFHFKRILSEMTKEHVKMLSALCDHDFSEITSYVPTSDYENWRNLFKHSNDNKLTIENNDEFIIELLHKSNNNRLKIKTFSIRSYAGLFSDEKEENSRIRTDLEYFLKNYVEKYFLETGIIEEISADIPILCSSFDGNRRYSLRVKAIHLTDFGVAFLKACRPSPETASAKREEK